jgi:DUF438 domain-containing protein
MSEEKDEAKEKTAEDEKVAEKPDHAEDTSVEAQKDKTGKADTKEKPLEKMTVKDLREMAKEVPGITGVHGMKKEELIVALKEVKGIKDEPPKKAVVVEDTPIAELKKKIRALKADRQAALEAKDKKMATICKRRISKLKKKTRRAAA